MRSVLVLLPSHHRLIVRHRPRVAELLRVAVTEGLDLRQLGTVVADIRGEFGEVARSAGSEFVCDGVVVVVLGIEGLVVIAAALVPAAVEPILARAPGRVPVLVVDVDDEPALLFWHVEDPLPGAS